MLRPPTLRHSGALARMPLNPKLSGGHKSISMRHRSETLSAGYKHLPPADYLPTRPLAACAADTRNLYIPSKVAEFPLSSQPHIPLVEYRVLGDYIQPSIRMATLHRVWQCRQWQFSEWIRPGNERSRLNRASNTSASRLRHP